MKINCCTGTYDCCRTWLLPRISQFLIPLKQTSEPGHKMFQLKNHFWMSRLIKQSGAHTSGSTLLHTFEHWLTHLLTNLSFLIETTQTVFPTLNMLSWVPENSPDQPSYFARSPYRSGRQLKLLFICSKASFLTLFYYRQITTSFKVPEYYTWESKIAIHFFWGF